MREWGKKRQRFGSGEEFRVSSEGSVLCKKGNITCSNLEVTSYFW